MSDDDVDIISREGPASTFAPTVSALTVTSSALLAPVRGAGRGLRSGDTECEPRDCKLGCLLGISRMFESVLKIFCRQSVAEHLIQGSIWIMGKICGTRSLAHSARIRNQSCLPCFNSSQVKGHCGSISRTNKTRTAMDQTSTFVVCTLPVKISGAMKTRLPAHVLLMFTVFEFPKSAR